MFVSKPIFKKEYDVCIIHLADARFYPFFHRQAQALVDKNLRVALVSWENKKGHSDPLWPGIDVYPIYIPGNNISGKLFFLRYFFSLIIILIRLKSKVYEAVDPPTLIPARIASFVNKACYTYFSLEYFQGVDQVMGKPITRMIWYLLEKIGIAKVKNVAAVCKTTELLLKKDFNLKNTVTIFNVPNKSEYTAQGDGRLRRRLELSSQVPIVLFKGEIADGRGLLPFVKALQSFPSVHFVCIGYGSFQPTVMTAASQSNCADRVHILEPVPSNEFVYYLKDANCGQVIHEARGLNMKITLPSKLFDCIHAGIPVIASNGPEISKVVQDWDVGWIVEPTSIDSIQKAISKFLAVFPNLENYRFNCAKAANEFCWEKEKNVYVDYIEKARR